MAKKKTCCKHCEQLIREEVGHALAIKARGARRNPRPVPDTAMSQDGVPVALHEMWISKYDKKGKKREESQRKKMSLKGVLGAGDGSVGDGKAYAKGFGVSDFLTADSSKAIKAKKYGWVDAVLYLAPSRILMTEVNRLRLAGKLKPQKKKASQNMCGSSTPGCRASCLFFSGKGVMYDTVRSRFRKTVLWMMFRKEFVKLLIASIKFQQAASLRAGAKLTVRLNGTSDVVWEKELPEIFEMFPDIMFYDYTKWPMKARGVKRKWANKRVPSTVPTWGRFKRQNIGLPPNYYLCFSYSDHKLAARWSEEYLSAGYGMIIPLRTAVAKVFLSETQGHIGDYACVDGDPHDLRFLDPPGSIVVLAAKAVKNDTTTMRLKPSADFFLEVSQTAGEDEGWATPQKGQWPYFAERPQLPSVADLKARGFWWATDTKTALIRQDRHVNGYWGVDTKTEQKVLRFGGLSQFAKYILGRGKRATALDKEYYDYLHLLGDVPLTSGLSRTVVAIPKSFLKRRAEAVKWARYTYSIAPVGDVTSENVRKYETKRKTRERHLMLSRLPIQREMFELEKKRGRVPLGFVRAKKVSGGSKLVYPTDLADTVAELHTKTHWVFIVGGAAKAYEHLLKGKKGALVANEDVSEYADVML